MARYYLTLTKTLYNYIIIYTNKKSSTLRKLKVETMNYRATPKKAIIFKIIYLVFSLLVAGFTAFVFFENIINGINNGLTFDDIIVVIATLFALLFEGSIIGFIIRSFKEPTILMKNLVFKNDGTPYVPGIVAICVGILLSCVMSVLFFLSAFVTELFSAIPFRAQYFILAVFLTLFVNFVFVLAYFFTFRHESGSFAII